MKKYCREAKLDKLQKNTQFKKDAINYIQDVCTYLHETESKVAALLPETNRSQRLQKEIQQNEKLFHQNEKPLFYNVLVGVKDLFSVKSFPTQAGSQLPSHLFESQEASCVTRLKANGAIILGKTVSTEFAYFQPGPTRNPHNINHSPGGSSSGSAAAVAAGYCPIALGTQTIGSVLRPASFCGIFGFKPSAGRISNDGVFPFSPTMDQIGYFAQDIEGIQETSTILCKDWQKETKKLKDPVFAIPHQNFISYCNDDVRHFWRNYIDKLKSKCYQIIQTDLFHDIEKIKSEHNKLIAYEFAQVHLQFKEYFHLYSPSSLQLIETGQNYKKSDIEKIKKNVLIQREIMEETSINHGIDLWISPSSPSRAPFGLNSTGNPIMNLPWTYVGVPAINIPHIPDKDLPYGIQICSDFNNDEILIQYCLNLKNII